MRIGEFGPKANRFLELYNCTVEIVQPAKHDTKVTEALGVFRVEIAGFVESGCSFAEPALMRLRGASFVCLPSGVVTANLRVLVVKLSLHCAKAVFTVNRRLFQVCCSRIYLCLWLIWPMQRKFV